MFAESDSDMVVDLAKGRPRMAKLEVIAPAPQMSVEPLDQLRQWCMTLLSVYQQADGLPFPFHCFARRS